MSATTTPDARRERLVRLKAALDAIGALEDDDLAPDALLAVGESLTDAGTSMMALAVALGATPPVDDDEDEDDR